MCSARSLVVNHHIETESQIFQDILKWDIDLKKQPKIANLVVRSRIEGIQHNTTSFSEFWEFFAMSQLIVSSCWFILNLRIFAMPGLIGSIPQALGLHETLPLQRSRSSFQPRPARWWDAHVWRFPISFVWRHLKRIGDKTGYCDACWFWSQLNSMKDLGSVHDNLLRMIEKTAETTNHSVLVHGFWVLKYEEIRSCKSRVQREILWRISCLPDGSR